MGAWLSYIWWGGDPDQVNPVSGLTKREIYAVQKSWAPVYANSVANGTELLRRNQKQRRHRNTQTRVNIEKFVFYVDPNGDRTWNLRYGDAIEFGAPATRLLSLGLLSDPEHHCQKSETSMVSQHPTRHNIEKFFFYIDPTEDRIRNRDGEAMYSPACSPLGYGGRQLDSITYIALIVTLFTTYPETKTFFKMIRDMPDTEYPQNFQFKAHVINLMSSLNLAIANLHQPEVVVAMMVKLGESHRRRQIKEQHFHDLKNVIVKMFIEVLNLDGDTLGAWGKTVDFWYKHIFHSLNAEETR